MPTSGLPITIHEVINMVICAGGVPVFADTERHTCNMDPAAALALLGKRRPSTVWGPTPKLLEHPLAVERLLLGLE